jgi:Zn-dependent protease with chaperone function
MVCVGVLALSSLAQNKPNSDANPFFPPGIDAASDAERFLEPLFGSLTPQESKRLAGIQISHTEACEFAKPQVQAYRDSLQQEGRRVFTKGKDVHYFRQLVNTIQPLMVNAMRYREMTIYVVDSPNVDARSFADGTLFFCTGLLTFCETEAALVGVVGHELSHLDRDHLVLPLKRARLLARNPVFTADKFDPQDFFAGAKTTLRLVGRPFQPEDETAADRDGAAWAYRAGYDPRELARLFARLHERSQSPKVPFSSFFRAHPYHDDRFTAIMQQYDELQQADPRPKLYRGKKNLAARIAKSQQVYPEG